MFFNELNYKIQTSPTLIWGQADPWPILILSLSFKEMGSVSKKLDFTWA